MDFTGYITFIGRHARMYGAEGNIIVDDKYGVVLMWGDFEVLSFTTSTSRYLCFHYVCKHTCFWRIWQIKRPALGRLGMILDI